MTIVTNSNNNDVTSPS